jgi:hypothetical protein
VPNRKAGEAGLSSRDARVGGFQRGGDEALAGGVVENRVQQRQHAVVQALGAQLVHAAQRVAGHQQLQRLVEDARARDVGQQRRQRGDRAAGVGVDVEVELGGKARGAQHAHRVFAEARLGVADHAQHALLAVGHAAEIVVHFLAQGVVVQRVDGEVAPRGVVRHVAEHVVGQQAAVLVGRPLVFVVGFLLAVGAEGGDLDGDAAAHHMHDLEAAPDDARTAEQPPHFFRRGIGGDVEILGRLAQQQVAHRAADDVALVSGLRQRLAGFQRAVVELVAADAVFGLRQNLRAVAAARGLRPNTLLMMRRIMECARAVNKQIAIIQAGRNGASPAPAATAPRVPGPYRASSEAGVSSSAGLPSCQRPSPNRNSRRSQWQAAQLGSCRVSTTLFPASASLARPGQQPGLMRGVEMGQRLVEQGDARRLHRQLRQPRALALAAGQRVERAVGEFGQFPGRRAAAPGRGRDQRRTGNARARRSRPRCRKTRPVHRLRDDFFIPDRFILDYLDEPGC